VLPTRQKLRTKAATQYGMSRACQGSIFLRMKITPEFFDAHLQCPTKCWLQASSEAPSGNTYAEWVKSQTEAYRTVETERLLAEVRRPSPPAHHLGKT
jgi:hypothetical protein